MANDRPHAGAGAAAMTSAPEAFGHAARRHFPLDPEVLFLNHGSYGVVPLVVLEAADRWRRRMECEPVRFLVDELPPALRAAAARLAAFLGVSGEDLSFVDNATTGMNAVLASLDLKAGDEIVTTDHCYGAVRQTLRHLAARSGMRVIEAPVPFPLENDEVGVEAVRCSLTPRTRLVVVDHVTSPTALVFPVARLAALARAHGVPILVDGAHAPGMLALDIGALGVDWYVGNCHKWLFAPRGCGFLWAAPERQQHLHPTVISHGFGHGFRAEFDWTGTRDHSPWLAVTAAIDFMERLGAGRVRARNHALAVDAAALLAGAWGGAPTAPPSLVGAMATLAIPAGVGGDVATTREGAHALRRRLFNSHRIEVPFMAFGGRMWLRISAQIYNQLDDYQRLASALADLARAA